ncbi:5'-3' exoribonuclease 1 [Lodderomyces elongisporus NRRL YB-4239]|uniref:5'-3' exoribonuclease 1 n=1 Tax=Lodderomyces elongisporus (strain ATCC 11503 / CBS 2605 / JCM 1781 / NBRC 1676 / NRRL YB-4239) TaxID=379508 RepID=A5E1D0_LODEL|nr:5'-3' exoribonuclease 1 [Lodderomyces elongisporus NRRL YB-4239]
MNSILHTCTHSNDGSLSRLSDDQMYAAIFNYIDHLFSIIKPKQTFYMAIDGVAPRAKMNQQRARRFRTAYEAEENLKKAIENGEDIPKEDPFDSNSITPGTEFMAKLTDNLKYFIHKKITEDSRWANVEIILSGHEVPGEGEHKIMEYIRAVRAQPEYDPNLRHCIYGLDADLIMLGLVSHDPHFALLREEVTFGPRRGNSSGPKDVTEQKFYLLHLSVLREYLELEFKEIEEQISFEFDFERILDDFILIMYVIGNDFLPHLPDLHLNKGAFPLLLSTFKQTLLQSDGYINEDGKINLKRLNIWVHHLSEFEFENFEEKEVDIEWFNKKLDDVSISGEKKRKKIGKMLILKEQKKLVGYIKPWLMEVSSQPVSTLIDWANEDKLPLLPLRKEDVENNLDFLKEFALHAGFLIVHSKSEDNYTAKFDVDGLPSFETRDDFEERINELRRTVKQYQAANLVESESYLNETKEVYQTKFKNWKNDYYKEKLHFSIDDKEDLLKITEHYVEGLQWVLYYYYRGCPSWNFYYRYHYAPRISDISLGLEALIEKGEDLKFEQSHPFKPFEQLMAVLPARSRKLMPAVYRPLMIDEKSPIIQFYPHEVDVDMNGKTATWEAVVLLDFVDEKKLIAALKPIEEKLTPEEKKRNSYGFPVKFIHNPQIDRVFSSPLPGFFHDIEHDKCYEEKFDLPEVKEYKIGHIEGARSGTDLLAGFPTLQTIPFTFELAQNEVKVFNFSSRSESMILNIENVWADISVEQFAQRFVGRLVYSSWPFLRECKVVKVVDGTNKFESVKSPNGKKLVVTNELDLGEKRAHNSECNNLTFVWDKTKAVRLGNVEVLVHVQPVNGLIRNSKGAYVKTYSKEVEVYPLQLIVKEVTNKDPRFTTRPPLPIDEEFPLGSQVVFLGDMAYGSPARVVGYSGDKLNVQIFKIQSSAEPNIGKRRLIVESKEIQYLPSFEVSKALRINPLLLSKITSQYMIRDGNQKTNIGLELKFESKRQKVLGYTRKLYNGKFWEFSPLAMNLINTYKTKFPQLFAALSKLDGSDMPQASQLLTQDELKLVRKWLKEVKEDFIPVSLESQSLTKFSFAAIENYMDSYIANPVPLLNKDIRGVPRNAILNASDSYQLLSEQKFDLGDRVVYVQDHGKVPILSKGTVGSIFTAGSKTSLAIIFDTPQLSGSNMNGKLSSNRGLLIDSSLVLNLTNRQFIFHSRASQNRKPLSYEEKQAKIKALENRKNGTQPQANVAKTSAGRPNQQSNTNNSNGKQQASKVKSAENAKSAKSLKSSKSNNKSKKGAESVETPETVKSIKHSESKQNVKGSNELLSLLKKKPVDNSNGSEKSDVKKKQKDEEQSDEKDERRPNPAAINQIYGHIFSNVMNEGANPAIGGYNQGVPLPQSQYMQRPLQQPQLQPQPQPHPHPSQFPQGYVPPNYGYPPQYANIQPPTAYQPQQVSHPAQFPSQHLSGSEEHDTKSTLGDSELKREPNAIDRFLQSAKKAEMNVKKDVEAGVEKLEGKE